MPLSLLLLTACGPAPISTDVPPSATGAPTTASPAERPCGSLLSSACENQGGLCLDPGPYYQGANVPYNGLEGKRSVASGVPYPLDSQTPYQCYTYVARMCSEGVYVVASVPSGAQLVSLDGFIIGTFFSTAEYADAGLDIDPACLSVYNGPPEYFDCAVAASEQAVELDYKCPTSRLCHLEACIIDEAP